MTQVPMVVRLGFPTAGTIKATLFIIGDSFCADIWFDIKCALSNDLPIYCLELNLI